MTEDHLVSIAKYYKPKGRASYVVISFTDATYKLMNEPHQIVVSPQSNGSLIVYYDSKACDDMQVRHPARRVTIGTKGLHPVNRQRWIWTGYIAGADIYPRYKVFGAEHVTCRFTGHIGMLTIDAPTKFMPVRPRVPATKRYNAKPKAKVDPVVLEKAVRNKDLQGATVSELLTELNMRVSRFSSDFPGGKASFKFTDNERAGLIITLDGGPYDE